LWIIDWVECTAILLATSGFSRARCAPPSVTIGCGVTDRHEEDAVATIIPRWEWRAFGARFGPAEAAFRALTPTGIQESDELYLLSGAGDNVKLRDDLMDVKVLKEVNADGLEQWTPVMKVGFPLAAADVAKVFEALHQPLPQLSRDDYTFEQFRAELVAPGAVLRTVNVHKRRVRYTVGGCISEVSDVVAGGKETRTIAIESEDPAAVIAAVRSVGLGDYVNTSYPRGLRDLIDGTPQRFAVIDVGTNSIKFHVGERRRDGTWKTLVDRAEVTRIGEGLSEYGEIGPEPLERAVTAIHGMVGEARGHDVRAIAAVGTAGLRMAGNREAVVAAVRERAKVTIEVLPGDEEARLAYVGVTSGIGAAEGTRVVFDTGGGSSQFTFGTGSRVDERFSVDVGAVKYTERLGLDRVVAPHVLQEAMAAIASDLDRLDGRPRPDALVGMGGAVTSITAVSHEMATYDPEVVQGSVLARAEIERQIELYRSRDSEARRQIIGLQPKRADVILAGACIVRSVMDKLGKDRMTVSDRGLRHGLLQERFGA
jgi:exopolyphosphatase/guanosine-5'-triphosphate,3'-diphosphate pyrophosphatase